MIANTLRSTTGPSLRVILAYTAGIILLDGLTFSTEMAPTGVTPWNPSPGLSLVLAIFHGLKAVPWLFAADLAADIVIRKLPQPFLGTMAADAILAVIYTMGGLALRRFGLDVHLSRQRDVFLLLTIGVLAAFIGSVSAVTAYVHTGMIDPARYSESVFRFWVGDAVGIAVTTPLVLVALSRHWWPAKWTDIRVTPEMVAQATALGFTQWIAYTYQLSDQFKFLYPLFIPMIWIAMRHGFGGSILGALAMQLGLSVSWVLSDQDVAEVTELQFALLSFTIICDMVGSVVSERKQADAEVRASERRWRSLFALAPVGIAEIDARGVVNSVNAALERLVGHQSADLVGQGAADVLPGIAGSQSRLPREVKIGDGPATKWLEVSVAEVAHAPGISRIAVFNDVSERHELERRRQAHQAEVAHTERINAAGKLASVMAHELNQPLTSIIYYLRAGKRLIAMPDGRADTLDALERAVAQAVRASEIIRNLRNFFMRGDSSTERLDIRQAVESASDLLAQDLRATHTSLELDLGDKPIIVAVDRVQFEQVLLNLLRNAIEAIREVARPGQLRVHARAEGEIVVIAVSDNGPGVPPAIAEDLFKPFTTSKSGGMGLGLTISRSLVEACSGTLDLDRTGPDGTTFAIRLPLARKG